METQGDKWKRKKRRPGKAVFGRGGRDLLFNLRPLGFTLFLSLFLFIFLQFSQPGLCAGSAPPWKVLIVSSYDPGHICGQPQVHGVLKALEARGFKDGDNLKVEQFFMDTLRVYTSTEQIEERGRMALEQITTFHPDLVITIDDNAARTVMLPLAGTSIPVVFSGMNRQPEYYNQIRNYMERREKPGGNVTGVYEKLHIAKALEVMHTITGRHKVAVILDLSPTGEAVKIQIEKEMARVSSPVALEFHQTGKFDEFKQIIRNINSDPEIGAIYPALNTMKTADDKNIASREILTWLLANSKKPEIAINHSASQMGFFGGAAVDFKSMGEQAGHKAAAILSGARAGDIPIDDADGQSLVFNLERARQLGITIPMDILSAADTLYETIALQPDYKTVTLFIVQSYEKDAGCGATIETGLLEGLAPAGFQDGGQLKLHHYYMDTQNTHITEEAIRHRAKLALAEIERIKPQIIVLMDDNAFEHVLPPLIGGNIPVFFAGTNVPLEWYNDDHPFMDSRQHPGKNVTGVTEEHTILQSLHLIKNLIPTIKTAVTIYSDSTPFLREMAQVNETYIREHQDSLPIRFIPSEKVTKLSDYQALIKKYDDDPSVDLIYTFTPISLIRDDGAISPAKETIQWVTQNQKKPDLTWMTDWVEAGYLASAGIDLKDTGLKLADKIVKVLAGANPGDLPIENPSKYSIALNLDRAKRLGLDIPVDLLEAADAVYSEKTATPSIIERQGKP
jgi:ABC-type uncharacterized transport system substrate-binding protein